MSPTTFPLELWANIMQYCSLETLRVLTLVSHGCREEARRYLYCSLYFDHDNRKDVRRTLSWLDDDDDATPPGTRIHNLSAFRHTLSVWPGWRSTVQDVRLHWTTNGTAYCWKEPERDETAAEIQLNELVGETATLLAESSALQNLHLSIPRLDSPVPFAVHRLTSLAIPITDCLHNAPDFSTLLKLFQIPSLRHVELLQMLRLNCTIPDHCRQPGSSNVTSLKFTQCGPVSPEIAHLLSWPKNLQTLHIEMDIADGLHGYPYDSGIINYTELPEALWPVQHCLQDLNVDILEDGGEWLGGPLQENAFQSFAKLRRLSIPAEMLIQLFECDYDGDSPDGYDPAPPLSTRLPASIQELHLTLSCHCSWGNRTTLQPSSETKLLVAYLSGLVRFPELREVRISIQFLADSTLPLELEPTRHLVNVLESSGIALSFPYVKPPRLGPCDMPATADW
ncbi:putative f-box domain cyclin-like protein [Diplodia seriata]|uniref:Putative f-box domain cyclin-like protein n=1 Tax=Diplodia seriata TaxID=420778 RepID=A0A0G2E2G2_9PEZI|nr:putative f-box domain cyclin-like protein [Diplodia seriata]